MARFAVFFAMLIGGGSTIGDTNPRQSADRLWPIEKSPELCDLGAEAESFVSLNDMPKAITADFLSRLRRTNLHNADLIAERDQHFNSTDGIRAELSSVRFVQGGHRGDLWFIWSEYGSMTGKQDTIITYEFRSTDTAPTSLGGIQGPHWGQSCSALLDFLNRHGPI